MRLEAWDPPINAIHSANWHYVQRDVSYILAEIGFVPARADLSLHPAQSLTAHLLLKHHWFFRPLVHDYGSRRFGQHLALFSVSIIQRSSVFREPTPLFLPGAEPLLYPRPLEA